MRGTFLPRCLVALAGSAVSLLASFDSLLHAPRSVAPGDVMRFTTLDPKVTGVVTQNDFSDPRLWDTLYQEWVYGGIGSGVAVGDFDNDGKPDLFVVSKCEQSRLFRNLGNWRFEDVTAKAGLVPPNDQAWQQGAVFADVNNDGLLDLYVCRFAAPNLLWINRGDGTFSEEAATRGLALVDASGMASFADYDRDGDLDVYVLTNMLDATKSPDGQPDHLFRNDGAGRFEEVTQSAGIAGISLGHSAVWWDYDADAWPDLYVSNDYKTPDRLYRNNRDGTFTDTLPSLVTVMPYYSMGADLGDVNGDGRIDFLAADMATSSREKDQRGFATSRTRAQTPPERTGEPYQVMRNALYLVTGTAHFQEAARMAGIAGTDWTWSVRFEDFDNDGALDLHVTNGMVREYHNADLLQKILGLENAGASRQVMKASPVMDEVDLAFRNTGDLSFEPVGEAWGLARNGVSFGVATADFDGDGDMDLVRTHYLEGVALLRNDSPKGNRLTLSLRGKESNRFGLGCRIEIVAGGSTQVRSLVTTRGYLSCSDSVVHFGLGNAETIDSIEIHWPSGAVQIIDGVSVNQHLVITEKGGAAKSDADVPRKPLFVEQSLPKAGTGNFGKTAVAQPFLPWDLNRSGPSLSIIPTRDGTIRWTTGAAAPAPRREWNADGKTADDPRTTPANEGPLVYFDANADGHMDLLETRSGTARPNASEDYQPKLWFGSPEGYSAAPADALPQLRTSVGAVTLADWDRDGDLDLFIGGRSIPGRYPLAPKSFLLTNEAGKFTAHSVPDALETVGLVTSAVWSDVDLDGWLDLVVTTEWGVVTCWKNEAGKLREWGSQIGFSAIGTGFWNSVVTGHFNGDGRPDFALGNAGLNTAYTAPAHLHFGDFKGGGSAPFILETVEEQGREYVRRTRNDLATRAPALPKRFPSNDAFARASLDELFPPAILAQTRRWSATELRSGVLLSQPNGTYQFEAFPRLAQLAPVHGMAVADFDGDGRQDLYLAMNNESPAPLTGPFLGGLGQLLLNTSSGWATPGSGKTGIDVPWESKSAAALDANGDGWADLVCTEGRGDSRLFLNQGAAGFEPLQIRVKDLPGNPHGIGARLVLEDAEGNAQTGFITALQGHMTQGDLSCFFGYKTGARPRTLTVHWPDGQATRHQVPVAGSSCLVERTNP